MIKLQNIHKRFGTSEVLKGIDLEIQRGEIVVIIGSSGTGKSTLLRCVNFLEQADQGSIRIDELTVDTQKHTKADVLALRRKPVCVSKLCAIRSFNRATKHCRSLDHGTRLEKSSSAPTSTANSR